MGRTLVYKRTHNGDLCSDGIFGCSDCMGEVRALHFDAVIGVGGQGAKAKRNGIARKVNWIGIRPHKTDVGLRGPLVTFEHFLDFGNEGPELQDVARHLADRMYSKKPRITMTFSPQEQKEVDDLLALAEHEPPSPALSLQKKPKKSRRVCRPKRC